MQIKIPRATDKQIKYIEALFIDVGIGIDRVKRNAYLKMWFEREIKFLDELTVTEGSILINKLKEIKGEEDDRNNSSTPNTR